MIEASRLAKSYGASVALRDLSFRVEKGEFVALLGPNGAGKTTALHILLGLITPDSGAASVLGLSPRKRKYELYPRINFCSSEVKLPFNLTVRQNLDIYARLYGAADPARKVDSLLELMDLGGLAASPAGRLSAGEQTRLNVAKCLLNDPELLLLDEPTANLDPDKADRVRSLLKTLHRERGLTILYTSHNMAEVEALCQRVIFVHGGRNVAEGPADEVVRRYGKKSLEEVFIHLARSKELPR